MALNEKSNEQHWKLLVLLLRQIAIEKHGVGWQSKLSELTGLKQSNISRIFSLKYSVSFPNFILLSKYLKVNFLFEDQEFKTEITECFEKAMKELWHRELPRD